MRVRASLILVSCLVLPAASSLAQTRNVDLTAADGVVLKASVSSPGKRGPGILLFHQCNANGSRRLWDGLAEGLVAAGFHVMTFDKRGFGETGGRGVAESPPGDGDAAMAYLLAQPDVDRTRLAVGGSSCGASDAADLAARRRDVRALLLLSGNASPFARGYLSSTPSVAVSGIYANQDSGADVMRTTIRASKHPHSTLQMFPGSGHGVELLQQHPDLQRETVQWLVDQVSQP